jgi:tRNA (cytidine/uridine-2'-O-)-methyltransferase
LDEKRVRRAGLDYHEIANLVEHDSLAACLDYLSHPRLVAVSTRGHSSYSEFRYAKGDAILFGPETRGLPAEVLDDLPASRVVRIPMQPENRSLNLANAAAVVLYEAWRQNEFTGKH